MGLHFSRKGPKWAILPQFLQFCRPILVEFLKTFFTTIRLGAFHVCSTLQVEALSTGPSEKLGFHTGHKSLHASLCMYIPFQLWNGVERHRQLWFYPAPRPNNSKWRRSLGFPYDCGQADHPGVCYAIVSSFSRIQLKTNVCSCCGINQFGIIQFDQILKFDSFLTFSWFLFKMYKALPMMLRFQRAHHSRASPSPKNWCKSWESFSNLTLPQAYLQLNNLENLLLDE